MSNSKRTVDLATLGEKIFGQQDFSQKSLTDLHDEGLAAIDAFVQAQFNIAVRGGDTESVRCWSTWAQAIVAELTQRAIKHGRDPR